MTEPLVPLNRSAHAMHVRRCLTTGLPASQVEIDSSRLVLGFYCLGALDLVDALENVKEMDREAWREWIWAQQASGKYGTGFKPSPYMLPHDTEMPAIYGAYDAPNLIMTYAALLSLAILRDDFARLDRAGLVEFLRACQREDGSFSTVPGESDSDLRAVYCAFAVASMLGDFGGVDVPRALAFIGRCRSYEGGYGQEPGGEALGGTTYCALAAMKLCERGLDGRERAQTVRWLVQNQDKEEGGFCGRTGKLADACYCFWCGAALEILGAGELVDAEANAAFLSRCQFQYGGLGKAPGDHPDPYHTYMSLAVLSIVPPETTQDGYVFGEMDAVLNARVETARWARRHIPA